MEPRAPTDTERPAGVVVTGAAVAAVAAGLVGLGTIGTWYSIDMGWTGSGSTIVDSRSPIVAAALVPTAAVLVGVMTLVVRGDVRQRAIRGVVFAVVNLVMATSVVVAIGAYPQVQQAHLTAIGSNGVVVWRTQLPITRVQGVRAESATAVTLEGAADRRGCDARHRSVTLDRGTGEILEIVALPDSYPDMSHVPPPPGSVRAGPGGFDVEQGAAPFVCRR